MRMLRLCRFIFGLVLLAVPLVRFAAAAEPAAPDARPLLSPIFGDHMVLQRGVSNPFWGWTTPGATVRVTLGGKSREARADADGRWELALMPPAAGGPYEMQVDGPATKVLHDLLVGDVWLCGGQSNMAFPLSRAREGEAALKTADQPTIRLFTVADRSAYAPAAVPSGHWETCTPATAAGFSAVGYFFAERLRRDLGVPIGVISDNVGGTPVESWISLPALEAAGKFTPQVAEIRRLHAAGVPELGSFLMHWLAEYDEGGKDDAWAQTGFDDSGWAAVDVPGGCEQVGMGATPGVAWFRRELDLSDPLPAGTAKLYLGEVEKMDTTYLNGHWVGASSWVENPRVYSIPSGVLHPGKNVIAIRVFKVKPGRGFLADPATLRLAWDDGKTIPLAGTWRGRLSVDARPPHPLPLDQENYPTMPGVLYNGMIAPVAPLALSGALWYQGEANSGRADQYAALLTTLIADWRKAFRHRDLPFYIVSLPAFMERRTEPGSDGWTEIREAQAQVAAEVSHSGIAITVDTGDAKNIHPTQKQVVGERLAVLALARHYGKDLPWAGPTYRSLERLPGALRLHFDHTDGGLTVHGESLGEFAVAGEDHVWHWAQAKIDGESVVVSSPEVAQPVAARYAWQANPQATLANGAGLPAAPFRTDDWPLGGK